MPRRELRQLATCVDEPGCLECLFDNQGVCSPSATSVSFCAYASCREVCAGPTTVDCTPPLPSPSLGSCVDASASCNPITSAGCDPGQACRPSDTECADASEAALCTACAFDADCPAASVCVGDGFVQLIGHCAALCCDDADCTGTCVPLDGSSSLGVCVAP